VANADKLETYATAYYTGTQASIWIGDVWVDEVFGISFSASQSILPIFGYASTFFDAVAKGKVLVQGFFEINFVDEGYLYAIFNDIAYRKGTSVNGMRNPDKEVQDVIEAQRKAGKSGQVNETVTATGNLIKRTQVDVILEQIDLLKQSAEGAYPNPKSRRQTMSQILNELSQLDSVSMGRLGTEIDRAATAPNPKTRNLIYEMMPFTLKGYFGNPELAESGAGAIKEIRDCFLIGNEMVVSADEDVVKERYSFLARLHV
jgi:hypothetical protein